MPDGGFLKLVPSLTRNPLGIIALFIALVYAVAALVFGTAGSTLDAAQRWPFVIFLVAFPIIVLGCFVWLVARHHAKLYSPADFADESNFMRAVEVQQAAPERSEQPVQPGAADVRATGAAARGPGARERAGEDEGSRAERLRVDGHLEEAVSAATRVLERDPDDLAALRTRAEAYRGLGRLAEAVRDATRALTLAPEDAFALRTRAEAQRGLGRFKEAVQDATRALELEPGDVFALGTRAEARRTLGQLSEALDDASAAIAADPGAVFARRTRAEAARGLSRFQEAIHDATVVLERAPEDAFALRTRASAFAAVGRNDEAIRDASEALRIEPKDEFALSILLAARSRTPAGGAVT